MREMKGPGQLCAERKGPGQPGVRDEGFLPQLFNRNITFLTFLKKLRNVRNVRNVMLRVAVVVNKSPILVQRQGQGLNKLFNSVTFCRPVVPPCLHPLTNVLSTVL